MKAVDSSVLVAALASWHGLHGAALSRVLSERPLIPAHVMIETYSVLTRLPAPHRLSADLVANALAGLNLDVVGIPPEVVAALPRRAAQAGVTGGAIYDALVAETSRQAGATLLTADRRAVRVYEALSVPFELVEPGV